MILSPVLSVQLRPKFCTWIKTNIKHFRSTRPSIKIAKDKFQLTIDVHNFCKDEIRVKARPEYVTIEGKQEKKTKKGFVMRQFVRKFKLPEGCSVKSMESKLSADGMLTITAPRKTCDPEFPCETRIQVTCEGEKKEDDKFIDVKPVEANPCDKYLMTKSKSAAGNEEKKQGEDKKPPG